MKLLHKGFDKLELSLQGSAPIQFLETLKEAKELAQQHNKEQHYLEIGSERRKIAVRRTGSKGGYSYLFETGTQGLLFMLKSKDNVEDWSIRCMISSLKLATQGLDATLAEMTDWLCYIGARGTTGTLGELCAKISRVDYCLDFLMPKSFTVSSEEFVFHSNMRKDEFIRLTGKSKRWQSLTIGSMPNMQVAIYDKTAEIRSSNKGYWHQIWNEPKTKQKNYRVWRFEFRSGLEHLNKRNARLLSELKQNLPNVMLHIHKNIRYVTPGTDSNRSRLAPTYLWEQIGLMLHNITDELPLHTSYGGCVEHIKHGSKEIRFKNTLGTILGLAGEEGYDETNYHEYFDQLNEAFKQTIENSPDHYHPRLAQAHESAAF